MRLCSRVRSGFSGPAPVLTGACRQPTPRPSIVLSANSVLRSLFFGLVIVSGCVGGPHRTETFDDGGGFRGLASWYGPSFHGKPSASGERYDMWALTAAHRTLPFGTHVRVESVETGKSVLVRINDRGPFIPGRIIDLSYGAARELAMIGKGTDEVILTVVGNDTVSGSAISANPSPPRYWVQAGSFQSLREAVTFQRRLQPHFEGLRVQTINLPSGEWHRVQIGAFSSTTKARQVASELEEQFRIDSLLIQDN